VHLSPTESAARGKAARRQVPRPAHGEWSPRPDRPDPVQLLEEQAETRVPDLVPIRNGRMAASPFAFFRGGALIMASDLASTARSGLSAQVCGDAHLMNFGGFAAPDRRLVFDLNDFDETLRGPWEWDVKRLAASLEVAGRELNLGTGARRKIVSAASAQYRTAMRGYARMRHLDVWNSRLEVDTTLSKLRGRVDRRAVKRAQRNRAKAMNKDALRAMTKLTRVVAGEPRFISAPPLVVPADELLEEFGLPSREAADERFRDLLAAYRDTLSSDLSHLIGTYRYVDVAHKVVGVGSVGTRAWIVLLLGRDDEDPLVLQAKEAQPSVLESFLEPSECDNHGERVVRGQRLMQAAGDLMLGWIRGPGLDGRPKDYYIRQLWDWKWSADVETMDGATLEVYAGLCGAVLARAHARSGERISIAAYLGGGNRFDEAMADFAAAYADQNEADHEAFVAAIASGRVEARADV